MKNYVISEELLIRVRNYIARSMPAQPFGEVLDMFMKLGNLTVSTEANAESNNDTQNN